MWETQIRSLGWEHPLEKGKAIHSSILPWRIPWGLKESDTTEQLSFLTHPHTHIYIYAYTFFFVFFSVMGYRRILNMVPHVIL